MKPPTPMKAIPGQLPPAGEPGWAYEIKWDGHRVLAVIDHGDLRLYSSNGNDVTDRFVDLHGLVDDVHADDVILDGEAVVMDADGRPSFSLIQQGARPVTFMVFDILRVNGHDIMALPYRERRAVLEATVPAGEHWAVPAVVYDDGEALLTATKQLGLEGIIAKRVDSPYLTGKRSNEWRKIKNVNQQEFVVGGWSRGERGRADTFGALIVGYYDGGRLVFAGKVGTGFDTRTLKALQKEFASRAVDECPFDPPPPAIVSRQAHWVRPELVAQVSFTEWTHDHILRHPVYLGLRDDKDPREVTAMP
ncbi:MAG: non-homologous end-joining DNA ligase [Acidimicrobiia bacterium]